MGKCVTALRPRYRPALNFSSLLDFTHDASAHVPAAVRRHLAPGATGWLTILAGCAFASAASAIVVVAVGFDAIQAQEKPPGLLCWTDAQRQAALIRGRNLRWTVSVAEHPNCTREEEIGQPAGHPSAASLTAPTQGREP
jgi:hypothetical protein